MGRHELVTKFSQSISIRRLVKMHTELFMATTGKATPFFSPSRLQKCLRSVPTMIPRELGYQHHGVEYWQREDPASETTTVKCDAEGEDPLCSLAIPSRGINMAHTIYFGIFATTPFCL